MKPEQLQAIRKRLEESSQGDHLHPWIIKADAEFIKYARKDIAALLAEVERLQAEIERLQELKGGYFE